MTETVCINYNLHYQYYAQNGMCTIGDFFFIGTVCIHSTENGRQQSPNAKL